MNSPTPDQILKTDTRGRVRVPPERRAALLAEFERSGLSALKFAELAGVKYATFANWRQKQRQQQSGVSPAASQNLLASVAPLQLFEAALPGGAGLTVELPGGARLRIEAAGQVRLAAELLGLLGQTARL
jgi:transposase-like protein